MDHSATGPAPCLAILPIELGDRLAPAGIPGFRVLRGVPLLLHAVTALIRSGCASRILVPSPASACAAVRHLLDQAAEGSDLQAEVLEVPGPGNGHRLRHTLDVADDSGELVVVHDPMHALAPASLVRSVVQALAQAPPDVTSAVPVRMVTDTLKWVDEDDVVTATANRDEYRMVYSPQAYRREALVAALAKATEEELRDTGAGALPRLVHRWGGRLVSVPADPEVFRIATDEDVELADAMLHVGVAPDTELPARP